MLPYRLSTIPRVTIIENLVKVSGITFEGIIVNEAAPRIGYKTKIDQPEYLGIINPRNTAKSKPNKDIRRIIILYYSKLYIQLIILLTFGLNGTNE